MIRMRLLAIGAAMVMAGGSPGWSQAPTPELEALRREVRQLRSVVEAQQAALAELKAALARLETSAKKAQSEEAGKEVTVDIAGQPFKGRPDAPVTIVEFSDFECPFCARFFRDVLPSVERELIAAGRLKYVYRDFPLPVHPYAEEAAYAGICADRQGKFWPMHDRMFSNPRALDPTSLRQHGRDLGLDAGLFESCLRSDEPKAEIERDRRDGMAAGVRGTPAFVIGRTQGTTVTGEIMIGVQSLEVLRNKVEALSHP